MLTLLIVNRLRNYKKKLNHKNFLQIFTNSDKSVHKSLILLQIIKFHKTENDHFGLMIKILSLGRIEKFNTN